MLFQVDSTLHELVLSSNGRHGTSVMLNCAHACSCILFLFVCWGSSDFVNGYCTKDKVCLSSVRLERGHRKMYNMAVAAAAEYVQSQDVHHRNRAGYNIITGCVLPQDVCITAGQLICLIKLQQQLVAHPYT